MQLLELIEFIETRISKLEAMPCSKTTQSKLRQYDKIIHALTMIIGKVEQ